MAVCAFPFTTSLHAFVLLDLLVRDVKLMWMNVQVSHALIEERASTFLKVIVANVLQGTPDCSVLIPVCCKIAGVPVN